MPPRGLKTRNRWCFDMYLFIYRKYNESGDYLGVMSSGKGNWKEALIEFMGAAGGQEDEDILLLYAKSLSELTLKEGIRLMYLLNGVEVTILDMFESACRIDFGQIPKDFVDSSWENHGM